MNTPNIRAEKLDDVILRARKELSSAKGYLELMIERGVATEESGRLAEAKKLINLIDQPIESADIPEGQ